MDKIFIPLACHSYFSLLWGTASVEDLCRRAKETGVPALALSDREGLYGILPFWEAARETGLKPILGAEIPDSNDSLGRVQERTRGRNSHPDRRRGGLPDNPLAAPRSACSSVAPAAVSGRGSDRGRDGLPDSMLAATSDRGPVRLLAAEPRGYRRLARLLTLYHQQKSRNVRPHRDKRRPFDGDHDEQAGFSLLEALLEDRQGLVVLGSDAAFLERLGRETGSEGLYAALPPLGGQREIIRWSRLSGIPLAAMAPVYFLDPADYLFHKLLRAIGLSAKLDRVPARELAPAWSWFQPTDHWLGRYLHCPEALTGMHEVTERCSLKKPPWGEWVFPPFGGISPEEAFALLERKARAGARCRYGDDGFTESVRQRLAYELEIIRAKSLASYFLVVEDIVQRFPITCGRGSAAASLVAYSLGITHVDPMRHNLFFERFLNAGRTEPPDIDVDFPWDERDAVLSYVLEKYGPEHCAMVANHVGFGARAALRETAKVYGVPEEEIEQVSREITRTGNPYGFSTLLQPPWPQVLHWASRLEGIPRHLSVHCGGVVITPDALPERVPVEQAHKGVPVIQWEKDATEAAGLVKIDLLGNRSLAVIRDAMAAIRAGGGEQISYSRFDPLEDRQTLEMLNRGDTVGVFYVESPAMRQLLQKTGKGDYEHLVVQSSIIRPAANEFIREYVRRVRGGSFTYLHPLLGGILRETHGILCYQEDVSRVAMVLAGFDAVQADLLRKILSKKHRQAKLADLRERFRAGALAQGVSPEVIEEVWRMILSFQGYSFCKPHSASYALVSFKSCYLKAHYPAEFMAAVISNQGGYYTTLAYLSEARRMGLRILPPDVNASAYAYTGGGRSLRVGLMQLKGARTASLEALLEERARRGPFRSLAEILERVDADPADFRILIKAGCLDSISGGRPHPELLWQLLAWEAGREARGGGRGKRGKEKPVGETAKTRKGGLLEAGVNKRMSPASSTSIEAEPGANTWGDREEEADGCGDMPALFSGTFEPPRGRPYSPLLRLRNELDTLGLLVSRHPLELYRPLIERLRPVPASELGRHVGKRVAVAGWFVTGKTVATSRDEPMEFVSFEDTTALYETTFFPKAYERFSRMIGYSRPYLLRGRVEEDFGAVSLNVEEVDFLERGVSARQNLCPSAGPAGSVREQ